MEVENVKSKGFIKAIDTTSVHRLCSGQVVLTLATAVKELVENSLDAGATNISIRFVKSGLESIEVSDNGSGVEEENFQALTLKHYTSKIAEFNDLVDVETYGFRGEALSSLCALSKVTITTRAASVEVGTKLCFDSGGLIISKSACPRQQGTTVMIEDIFSTLPVRRKEFEKNVSREFGRMVNYISGYCLIQLGLKLTITNLSKNNSAAINVLRVTGNDSVKGNIMDVFGVKQWTTLVEFVACNQPDEDILEELGISSSPDKISSFLQQLTITGYISSAVHGQGRSASDRQFFFVNRRPFDSQKLSRMINEVYHSFNRNQHPFVVLDVRIARSCVDVNVTPDKRQVFLQNEKILLAIIKTSLKKMYAAVPSVCKLNSATPSKSISEESFSGKKRNFTEAFQTPPSLELPSPSPSLSQAVSSMKKQRTLDSFATVVPSVEKSKPDNNNNNGNEFSSVCKDEESGEKKRKGVDPGDDGDDDDLKSVALAKSDTVQLPFKNVSLPSTSLLKMSNVKSSLTCTSKSAQFRNKKSVQPKRTLNLEKANNNDGDYDDDDDDDDGDKLMEQRKAKVINFSLARLKEKLQNHDRRNCLNKTRCGERRFRAQIQPSDNEKAESELQKMISKDMFGKMEVLGQFNLGFIITKLNQDLFIVDQHATDEKFNFERLQKSVILQNQKLIRPMRMELTASNESVLMENMEIFLKNGFEFHIDPDASLMDRIKLTSIPTSKNWMFGQQDIEEMIFMLTESPGVMCRPSRIRQMLASRACRSSVMIGTALNVKEMKKLVRHMGEIDQPWNCPHGRPTIRHLIDINMLEH